MSALGRAAVNPVAGTKSAQNFDAARARARPVAELAGLERVPGRSRFGRVVGLLGAA